MTLFDGPPIDKRCFVYCGDECCDCLAGPRGKLAFSSGSMTDEMREAARHLATAHAKRAEEATKALLARWVSELPATIAYDEEYRVIGASYGGEIVLCATLAEPTATR